MLKNFTRIILPFILVTSLHAQWQTCKTATGSAMSLASGGNILYIGLYGQGVSKTTDDGLTVANVGNGLYERAAYVRAVAVKNSKVFAAGIGGVYCSSDSGQSWFPAKNGLDTLDILSLYVKGDSLFAGSYGRGVFLSNDDGQNWVPRNMGMEDTYIWCIISQGNDLYAAAADNRGAYRSSDGGQKWVKINKSLGYYTSAWCLAATPAGIFAGTDIGVYFSANRGDSWQAMTKGLTDLGIRTLAVSGNDIFACTYSGIFQSSDGGANWKPVNEGLTDPNPWAIVVQGQYLFAAGIMGNLSRRPLSEMITAVDYAPANRIEGFSLEQNYPNPFNSSTTFEFTIPRRDHVTLSIHDLLGREFARIKNEEMNPGHYSVNWQADNITSGAYYYRLEFGHFILTRKLLLLR